MWIKFWLAVLLLVQVAIALQCYSCDNFISCDAPTTVTCPPQSKCYTLGKGEKVIAKGCAHSCFNVMPEGSRCFTCNSRNLCNKLKEFKKDVEEEEEED